MTPNQLIDLLIEGTNVPHDAEEGTRLTNEEIRDTFWPEADLVLSEVAELLPSIAGYGTEAKLYVKWGYDDPTADPIKLPATPTDSWDYTSSRVELYADQIRIVPKGPGSSGAGDVVIWYSFTPPPLEGEEGELLGQLRYSVKLVATGEIVANIFDNVKQEYIVGVYTGTDPDLICKILNDAELLEGDATSDYTNQDPDLK